MRAPFQVLVFPYRFHRNNLQILIGKRCEGSYWQSILGGGEDDETVLEAAIRELKEETTLEGINWVQLDSMCMLPKNYFVGYEMWANVPFVIPEYSFMTEVIGNPVLSDEHSEFKWCSLTVADELLKFDSNKIALWELGQRVKI